MPKNHEGGKRQFVEYSRAWYADAKQVADGAEVMFGIYYDEGGTSGEMACRWKKSQGNWVPQLQIFDDAWSALATMPDLVAALGSWDNDNLSPMEFCHVLVSCGFTDRTPTTNPYAKSPKTATVEDSFRRIADEAIALGAGDCPPAPHACPKCEILHLATNWREQ